MKRRYAHQLKATELCFKAFHLDELGDKRKLAYCRHELFIMFGISVLYARLNGSDQAEADLAQLWENCRAYDEKWADYFRWRTALRFVCIPGKGGAAFVRFMYHVAHRVVRFN